MCATAAQLLQPRQFLQATAQLISVDAAATANFFVHKNTDTKGTADPKDVVFRLATMIEARMSASTTWTS